MEVSRSAVMSRKHRVQMVLAGGGADLVKLHFINSGLTGDSCVCDQYLDHFTV